MTKESFKVNSEGLLDIRQPHPEKMSVIAALRRSISKWYYILKHKDVIHDDDGVRTCALCYLYFRNGCKGCPVNKVTQEIHCEGSPYAVMDTYDTTDPTFKNLEIPIRAEIHFLEELLRKEVSKKQKVKAKV